MRIDSLSSEPGHRAKLAVQGLVGGDSALDLKGELTPFGDLYADVAGEVRKFGLPAVNPYAENAIAWIIEQGTLTAKLHYTVERDRLTAKNEIIVENLHVAKSGADDEVQKRRCRRSRGGSPPRRVRTSSRSRSADAGSCSAGSPVSRRATS